MSSHMHKVMQVLGESLYMSGKYLDYEEKYMVAKSKVEFLFAENESLKGQISALTNKAKKDKDFLKTLEKSIDTEKYLGKHHPGLDFSKLGMKAVEKEILTDRQSRKGVGEGGEVAAVDKAVHFDPSSSALP
ncbi:hypothetical protein SO802_025774 [Lithocarpus litseifolius]|uniref:Uncharacterized protein n=1 Tax=Lithocarpus litseifolius TaxID=425828 RepID=A0AAW2BXY4_9ROSI